MVGPEATVDAVERGYGIDVSFASSRFNVGISNGAILGDAVDPKQRPSLAQRVCAEVLKYPPAFLLEVQLQRIVLCSDLSLTGRRSAGLADHESRTIYLDVSPYVVGSSLLETTLHHELFHLIDGPRWNDEAWLACNPPTFVFPPEGLPLAETPPEGFVSSYATTAPWEDKAELFAAVMVDPVGTLRKSECDGILRRKLALMRSRMDERFALVPLPVQFTQLSLDSSAPHAGDSSAPHADSSAPHAGE